MARPSITPEKREEMRSHVREAVVRLVRKRNIAPGDTQAWNDISIRDVIEEAGISIGTFYKYFENRADLAQTLWAEPVGRLRDDMQASVDAVSDPVEKVRVLLTHYVAFALDNDRLFRSAFLLVRDKAARPATPEDLNEETFYRNLCAAFREGQASGQFKPFDPDMMAQIFWAGIHGSLALPINLDRYEFEAPEVLSAHMIDALMELVEA
ncbi:MAG: TetR/AcrR family transcriptional regulator [Alphaproteobacteria bacterium]|nr:TetR/AcrR family transcriptional regulator [Alphaproteobacteria bacterium]